MCVCVRVKGYSTAIPLAHPTMKRLYRVGHSFQQLSCVQVWSHYNWPKWEGLGMGLMREGREVGKILSDFGARIVGSCSAFLFLQV